MKNMKKFYITFLLSIPLLLFSQGENNYWYFGQKAAVNFDGSTPLVPTDSEMEAEEAVGTVSDANGKLLFYTNGVDIYNRQHQIMQNGSAIGGGISTAQLVIVKNPANPKQYYIFTGAEIDTPGTYLAYTIVDMNQGSIGTNGHPLGKVLSNFKRIPVLDNNENKIITEAITAVSHSDASSFWILTARDNNLYSYRLSSAGFNPVPVVSSLGLINPLLEDEYFGIKASPKIQTGQGFTNYISLNMWRSQIHGGYMNKVMSFENSTGQITNHFALNINTSKSYSSEFNQNGKILYLGFEKVYAIDLANSVTFPIYNQIYSGSSGVTFYGIQRNKYNDIYLSNFVYPYLSKIKNPNIFGGSSVELDAVDLKGKLTYLGLPQQMLYINTRSSECITDLVLQNPEVNTGATYSVNNYIITSNNYTTDASQSIVMKAKNFISFLPNTNIKAGSDLLAKIAPCQFDGKEIGKQAETNQKRISLTLDLRDKNTDVPDVVSVYPNPASDFIKIQSDAKVTAWELYDLSGKMVLKGNGNNIDVKSIIKGAYALSIILEKGTKVSKKIIVK